MTTTNYSLLRPVPQLPGFAARIDGLDLAQPLSAPVKAELHQALLDFGMLVFPPQHLTPEQHIELASAFGDISTGAFFPRLEGYPQVEVISTGKDNPPELNVWHSDVTWRADFPTGTVIQLKEVPPSGGNTVWACGAKAFSALSAGMQQYLRGLTATHSWQGSLVQDALQQKGEDAVIQAIRRFKPVVHPVVRRHEESGKEVLFVNEAFTRDVNGVPPRESRALLEFLREWMVQPEFAYSHRWEPDGIAVWDNRSTQHYASADYWRAARMLRRVTFQARTSGPA